MNPLGRSPGRSLLLVVALAGAPYLGADLLGAGVAFAQTPAAFADLVIDLLPSGEVTGDGLTPVTWHLVAMDRNGAPMGALQAKFSATDGSSGKLVEIQPGLYRVEWTPPAVQAARTVEISIKGKTATREAFSRTWAVPVVPPLAQRITATANPPQIVLGQDTGASVTFTLSGGAAQAAAEGEIVVSCSSGTVQNLTPLGGGSYTALYTAPAKQFPHLAVITVADRRDPSHTYGALTIPLVGKANFPVTGMPGSRIILKLADREFGPIQADASGRAQVPIVVPPGVGAATVISVLNDKKTEEPIDLQIPGTPRARLFPIQANLAADPAISVPIRVYVSTPQGGPDAAAQVKFATTAGQVGEARHEGNGVYVATFTPPFGNAPVKATLQVTVEDPKGAQTDALDVNLVPARPAQVAITPEPARLGADAASFKVLAKVTGPDGVGMSAREIAFVANGAKLTGDVKDLGNGDYHGSFSTTGSGPVELLATAKATASANPLRRVIVIPTRDRLPNDGLSSAMLTILTLDEFGYPVAGVPVEIKVAQGDGTVPVAATTDGAGIAQVHYTAGRQATLANVVVTAKGHTGGVGILQAPPTAGVGLALPMSGSQAKLDLEKAWSAIVTSSRIEREALGAVAPPPPVPVASGPPGAVATVNATSEPASVAPGGTVTLRVQVMDAAGRGTPGQKLEFITSAGTVGAVQDLGGGVYQTSLSVPAGVAGEVKVSVAAPPAAVAGFLKIPVVGGSAWGTAPVAPVAPPPATTPAPAAGTTPAIAPPANVVATVEKKPRPAGAWPWLRVSAGYLGGLYSYQQKPFTSNGPLYNRSITVGGDAGDPGGAAGVGLRGRMWVPGLDFLGAAASIETAKWSMELEEGFDDPVSDWLTDLRVQALARYPFETGGSRLHAGARLGLATSDFIVYKQETENQRPVLVYEQLVLSGLGLGAELGGEFGKDFFALAAFDTALMMPSTFFTRGFDLSVGYVVYEGLFVQANGGYEARTTPVYSNPANADADDEKPMVGELRDGFTNFGVGVGWQM